MSEITHENVPVKTHDGAAPCHAFFNTDGGPRPAAILFMDAFGPRPDLFRMGRRLAEAGYYVLLPDLYYRGGPYAPIDVATAFAPGPERDRVMKLFGSIDNAAVMRDMPAFLKFLDSQPDRVSPGKIGCVGYCMGGGFALTAAGTFPDRVAAAASFHGAGLATEAPSSPHLLAPRMRAKVYIGIAGIDPHFTPEEQNRLAAALSGARVDHQIETYEGVRHGFAVYGTPAYDQPASERHWGRLLGLFESALR